MAVGDLGEALKRSLAAHQEVVRTAREAATAAAAPPETRAGSPTPASPKR